MKHSYIVNGDGFLLKPLEKKNLEKIRIWRNQDNIRKCFVNPNLIESKNQIEWFESYLNKNNDIMFIIYENQFLNREVGAVALYNIDKIKKEAEFGRLMIGDIEALGKGLGLKVVNGLCKFGFEQLGLNRIHLCVYADNEFARKIYEKSGFVCKKKFDQDGRGMYLMDLYKVE